MAVVQETSERTVSPAAPGGGGVGWIVQAVPSHRSARVELMPWPTAVQALAEVYDTPSSALPE